MAKKEKTARPGAAKMALAGNMKTGRPQTESLLKMAIEENKKESKPPARMLSRMAHAGNMKAAGKPPTESLLQMAIEENKKEIKQLAASKSAKKKSATTPNGKEKLISSEVVYQGPLFRVLHDKLIEPGGKKSERDVIRHNGSVVILAIDNSKDKKDPWVVMERQYRHAATQYLWELPAGKLDAGEDPVAGAQRELQEETGYRAKKWTPLVEYYGSPGFLGESMKVFLAEGLVAGEAHPEDDEEIEFRLVKLSEVVRMIEKGVVKDGKTLCSCLLYARQLGKKSK